MSIEKLYNVNGTDVNSKEMYQTLVNEVINTIHVKNNAITYDHNYDVMKFVITGAKKDGNEAAAKPRMLTLPMDNKSVFSSIVFGNAALAFTGEAPEVQDSVQNPVELYGMFKEINQKHMQGLTPDERQKLASEEFIEVPDYDWIKKSDEFSLDNVAEKQAANEA